MNFISLYQVYIAQGWTKLSYFKTLEKRASKFYLAGSIESTGVYIHYSAFMFKYHRNNASLSLSFSRIWCDSSFLDSFHARARIDLFNYLKYNLSFPWLYSMILQFQTAIKLFQRICMLFQILNKVFRNGGTLKSNRWYHLSNFSSLQRGKIAIIISWKIKKRKEK